MIIHNPWRSSSIRTALEGRSFIDAKRIHIHTLREAELFLESYGYDIDDEVDQHALQTLRDEAIELIENELLLAGERIPTSIKNEQDVRQYLLIASGHGRRRNTPWAGSVLRVMHTLAHSQSYLNELYHEDIRDQIFSRFEKELSISENQTRFGEIDLFKIEFRKAKSRWSVAMKLMHKAENVAADIFDWIGIRFITHYRADALDLLAYLRNQHIIAFSNIKPSRSRNNLIDLKWVDQMIEAGVALDVIRAGVQELKFPVDKPTDIVNQFSEISYHSIQITCRQRIKIEQPDQSRLTFFFPYEVQIMDKHSYQASREGLASHDEYKKRQKQMIRKRILPFLK